MKLDFCAVCGATEDLHQHHLIPVIKTGVKRHKKRYNGDIQLKDAQWQDCFLRLFDLGVITDDGELTLCSYHHNVMHGVVKFHAVEQGKLIKQGMEKARANGVEFGRKTILNDKLVFKIKNLREKGHSMRAIAKRCDVSTSPVQKALKLQQV